MSFDCANLEQYPEADACVSYVGGQSKMVVVKFGVTVDSQSEAEVNAAIAAGNATLIDNVIIALPEPSGITVASNIACQTDSTITYDRTITLRDGKATQLVKEFFDSLNNSSGFVAGQLIVYSCSENRQYVITGAVKFTGGLVIPENDTEAMTFNYTGAWRAKYDADIEAANPVFA